MSEKIKTKNYNKGIRVLNKSKNLEHYKKINDVRVKNNSNNSNEEKSNDGKTQAVDKVTDREKLTALQTASRGKKLFKKKLDQRNQKNSTHKSMENNKDAPITSESAKKAKDTKNIKKLNMKSKQLKDVKNHKVNNYNSRMNFFYINKSKRKILGTNQMGNMFRRSFTKTADVLKGSFNVIRRTVLSINHLISIGCSLILLIVVALFIGVFSVLSGDSGTNSATESLSQQVIEYRGIIEKYAVQYEIRDYVPLIQAVMMQESGGEGNDPMQSSECKYNVSYPRQPGGITNPEYSIDCGVHYLADCLKEAKVKGITDMDNISLALQGYNFGNGYISWAVKHFSGYTRANATVFSDQKKVELNISVYGDPDYVPHVLRYYHLGNGDIVSIALSQIGNVGGKPYWSWYGFESRVEWCACFISWCANESGQLNISIPKFSRVEDGIKWFKDNGKWKDKSYVPSSGDIIFFDWQKDNDPDHVGIVEKVENGYVYTVEGNSNDECKQKQYSTNSKAICGFGINR